MKENPRQWLPWNHNQTLASLGALHEEMDQAVAAA